MYCDDVSDDCYSTLFLLLFGIVLIICSLLLLIDIVVIVMMTYGTLIHLLLYCYSDGLLIVVSGVASIDDPIVVDVHSDFYIVLRCCVIYYSD